MNDREDVDFESASVLVKSSRNNLGCFDDSIRESPVHGDGPVERPPVRSISISKISVLDSPKRNIPILGPASGYGLNQIVYPN